ncbi:MAG TPA: ABC transporter ATP-binding protein [Longilinea sp.]|nr:ABC transporter ATP-binding protein [Longilinea sp.]
MVPKFPYRTPDFTWDERTPIITVRDLNKVFTLASGDVQVLKHVNLEMEKGEFVGIVGRSGCGKSTLVNMITGIDHPSSGEVTVAGQPLQALNEGKLSEWRGRTLGIVFQFFQLLPTLTLIENVMLPMDFCRMFPPAEREERARQLLARVGLEKEANKFPGAVSSGQQQSAAVARALANDVPILVADEPTGNLDSRSAEEIIQLFQELVAQGKTILMVTHDLDLAQRTDRIIHMSDGVIVPRLIAEGAQP